MERQRQAMIGTVSVGGFGGGAGEQGQRWRNSPGEK